MKHLLLKLTKSRHILFYNHGKTEMNNLIMKKKVVGVLAIILAIAAISAYTLPALATSDNSEQVTGTSQNTCDQTCAQDRTRLRDGSCGDGAGTGSCDGTQKQYRYGLGAIGGSSQGSAQHRYGKGSN
jgi:hypothetical protein